MQFRIPLSDGHSVTFERDAIGNVLIVVNYSSPTTSDLDPKANRDVVVASGVERGKDFSTMAVILGD